MTRETEHPTAAVVDNPGSKGAIGTETVNMATLSKTKVLSRRLRAGIVEKVTQEHRSAKENNHA